jgi:hypothetical protein
MAQRPVRVRYSYKLRLQATWMTNQAAAIGLHGEWLNATGTMPPSRNRAQVNVIREYRVRRYS